MRLHAPWGPTLCLAACAVLAGCERADDPTVIAGEEGSTEPISEGPWTEAARRGVTFRALGNEPAWSIEVTPEHLVMITELGTQRAELPYEATEVDGSHTNYRATGGGHQLLAQVERVPCADTMSGEEFEATVTVTFDGATYHGCGRYL